MSGTLPLAIIGKGKGIYVAPPNKMPLIKSKGRDIRSLVFSTTFAPEQEEPILRGVDINAPSDGL